jgi:UDP-N-acetylenolpyruvoylglucosamine reductase
MDLIIDASGQNFCIPYEIRSIKSKADVIKAIQDASRINKKIIMHGTKHSQAGQICWEDAIALDMTGYNKVVNLNVDSKQITVESGIMWRDILHAIDPHHLSLQIMQFVSTFSVGGSLSANIFSRDPRKGRLIELIESFSLATADQKILRCSRNENSELFYLAVEGHGLFGVILEVTIKLIENTGLIEKTCHYTIDQFINRSTSEIAYQHAELIDHHILSFDYHETNSGSSFTRNELLSLEREKELTFWNRKQSDVLIGFFIPAMNFQRFHQEIIKVISKSSLPIFKCGVNYIKNHKQSYLSISEGPWIKFSLFYRLNAKRKPASDVLKKTCSTLAIQTKGAPYLTFDFITSSNQMDQFFPNWRNFLNQKRLYDPKEMFYNQFYQRLCDLITCSKNYKRNTILT